MTRDSSAQLTRMLRDLGRGRSRPADELLPLVYEELRSLARARLAREKPGQTLQATVLVHEAYQRLVGGEDPGWNSRNHFFSAAAQAMRRILVEQARRKRSLKRGGGVERQELVGVEPAVQAPVEDVIAVDEAVRRLEARNQRQGQIVNLRYFAGLTLEETAGVLGVSVKTVEKEWRFIKAWLQTELASG